MRSLNERHPLQRANARLGLALTILLGCVAASAQRPNLEAIPIDPDADLPRMLSEYGFFRVESGTMLPNNGVLPYDLSTPLFSDYTAKHRYLWMPHGVSARYHPEDSFDFPVGTVLIKTFAYWKDMRDPSLGERLLETRLLIHRQNGWQGLPYIWNEEQTDAVLKVAGGAVDVSWIHSDGTRRTNNYLIPNTNECKSCHENADTFLPIGPKARNLNKIYLYKTGPENQLLRWAREGYLVGAPDPAQAPRLPVWNRPETGSLDSRARAWLEINCMHCHNPDGAANTSGLDLSYSQKTPAKLGIMKPPAAAGQGAGEHLYDIVPGKPDESIMIFRLESTNPGIMMPELPGRLVDEEGLALIREWITHLSAPPSR